VTTVRKRGSVDDGPIEDMRTFIAVVENRSFANAAAQLAS